MFFHGGYVLYSFTYDNNYLFINKQIFIIIYYFNKTPGKFYDKITNCNFRNISDSLKVHKKGVFIKKNFLRFIVNKLKIHINKSNSINVMFINKHIVDTPTSFSLGDYICASLLIVLPPIKPLQLFTHSLR